MTFTNQVGLSNSSSVNVTVNPTVSAITLAPALVNVDRNATQQFTATAKDQFGVNLTAQPSFTWTLTAGGGSLSSTGLYTAPGTGTLATVTATSGSVSGNASVYVLSSPYATQDVGSVAISGDAGDNGNGTFVVAGSGAGIGGTADAFRFAYQTLSGNGAITAHFDSQQITGTLGLAGLMIRNDLTAGATMAFMGLLAGGGTEFEDRATTSRRCRQHQRGRRAAWIRLVRSGTTFTGYYSLDGVTSIQQGSATIAMGTTVDIGIGATGESNGTLDTATFDQASLDLTPTIATAAASTPSPASGTTASLSVLGADLAGESTLTYTWMATTVPTGARRRPLRSTAPTAPRTTPSISMPRGPTRSRRPSRTRPGCRTARASR